MSSVQGQHAVLNGAYVEKEVERIMADLNITIINYKSCKHAGVSTGKDLIRLRNKSLIYNKKDQIDFVATTQCRSTCFYNATKKRYMDFLC